MPNEMAELHLCGWLTRCCILQFLVFRLWSLFSNLKASISLKSKKTKSHTGLYGVAPWYQDGYYFFTRSM